MNKSDKLGVRRLVSIRDKTFTEPLAYHGEGTTAAFPISYAKACRLVASPEVKPARLTMGLSLVNVTILDFHTSPFGPYSEMVFSIPVLYKTLVNLPFVPLLLHKSVESLGFFIVDILYSTEGAATGGVLLAEGPHNRNLIRLEHDQKWERITVLCDGAEILTLQTSQPKNPKPVRQTYRTYVTNDARLVRIRMDIAGVEKKIGRCNLTIKDHRLSQTLHDLDISSRAVEARSYSSLTELFPVSVEHL